MNRQQWLSTGFVCALSAFAGCSSSDKPAPSGGAGTGGTPTQQASTCTAGTLQIAFAPMYSAYDGVHKFQVPAIVKDVDAKSLTWKASDPSMVDLESTADGVMITTRKAGTVDIVATSGSACGTAKLTITQATDAEWKAGSARYNMGIVLMGPPDGGAMGPPPDGGFNGDAGPPAEFRQAACTNCHGDTATNLPFKTISHSPQQTGGFSDADLRDIITKGIVPAGGYFDETIVPKNVWSMIHKWDMTEAEVKGVIVYLRSLTPVPQNGKADFSGFRRPDAGAPDAAP